MNIYNKRTDTQEEAYVFNMLFDQVKEQVVEKFPYLESLFVKDPGYKCIHTRKGYRSNCVYGRNPDHLIDNDENAFTFHEKTRDELVQHTPFRSRFFTGTDEITESQYNEMIYFYNLDKNNM